MYILGWCVRGVCDEYSSHEVGLKEDDWDSAVCFICSRFPLVARRSLFLAASCSCNTCISTWCCCAKCSLTAWCYSFKNIISTLSLSCIYPKCFFHCLLHVFPHSCKGELQVRSSWCYILGDFFLVCEKSWIFI